MKYTHAYVFLCRKLCTIHLLTIFFPSFASRWSTLYTTLPYVLYFFYVLKTLFKNIHFSLLMIKGERTARHTQTAFELKLRHRVRRRWLDEWPRFSGSRHLTRQLTANRLPCRKAMANHRQYLIMDMLPRNGGSSCGSEFTVVIGREVAYVQIRTWNISQHKSWNRQINLQSTEN